MCQGFLTLDLAVDAAGEEPAAHQGVAAVLDRQHLRTCATGQCTRSTTKAMQGESAAVTTNGRG